MWHMTGYRVGASSDVSTLQPLPRNFGNSACKLAIYKPAGMPPMDPPDACGLYGWSGYRTLLECISEA